MSELEAACLALSSRFGDNVSFPGIYDAAIGSYYSAQEQRILPACMVTPTSNSEVAEILKILVKHQVNFAIRGGGHTLNAHAANIDGGITINLRPLNQVVVNADEKLVSIGGGAKWDEVYPALDALSIATSGGRLADVGVGGLVTGGGISFFSAREGLVCDNVVNYEVVLANGSIISAKELENGDLYIALKGGSNNFGIVTRFDIRTFPQEKFFGGVIVSAISTIDEQLKGFSDLLHNFDPDAAIIMSISWNQVRNSYSIFHNLQYTKNNTSPVALQPFLQAQPQYLNTMRISDLTDFTAEAGNYAVSGMRNQFATTTFGGSLDMLTTVYEIWKTSVSSISSIKGINWAISLQPLPPAFIKESNSLGGNSLGLSTSSGPLTLFLLSYNWVSIDDDEEVTAAAQKLIADIDAATMDAGYFNRFKYLNYASSWQDSIAGYGEENVERLRDVSRKDDPDGVFQVLCPGGFKIDGK